MEEGEGFTGLAWLAINVSCSTVAGRIKASFNTHVSDFEMSYSEQHEHEYQTVG